MCRQVDHRDVTGHRDEDPARAFDEELVVVAGQLVKGLVDQLDIDAHIFEFRGDVRGQGVRKSDRIDSVVVIRNAGGLLETVDVIASTGGYGFEHAQIDPPGTGGFGDGRTDERFTDVGVRACDEDPVRHQIR